MKNLEELTQFEEKVEAYLAKKEKEGPDEQSKKIKKNFQILKNKKDRREYLKELMDFMKLLVSIKDFFF